MKRATAMRATNHTRFRRFHLKPAYPTAGRWMGMPDDALGGWSSATPRPDGLQEPGLLDQHFGQSCNYGALFTYLFRRFGLPNDASDDYKEIAAYCLSTPLPDLVLVASPSVSKWPRLSLRFQITQQTWQRLETEPQQCWLDAMADWVEARGPLPAWMDVWLDFWRAKPGVAERTTGNPTDWRLSIHDMNLVKFSLKGRTASTTMTAELRLMLGKVAAFVDSIQNGFHAVQAHPARRERAPDWRAWPDDDPLKPYYAAAAAALEDLSTPVRIRDSQINAHGIVEESSPLSRQTVKEPAVAGIAFGYYVNRAPAAAAQLLIRTAAHGRGNLAKGFAKLFPTVGA